MMTKTTKQRVVEKVITALPAKVQGKNYNVLPHQTILNLSWAEDSATRRLREMAEQYGTKAYEIKKEIYLIEPSFVNWLKTNR